MRLYLGGPMRGYDLYNFPAFDAARDLLTAAGHEVVSPADLDRAIGFDPARDSADETFVTEAMRRDLAAIDSCDAVALLDGWESSEGANAEVRHARARHKRLFRLVDGRLAPLDEERVTDPRTGGQKGRKLAQLGAVDPLALMRVAEVAGFGAQKYERFNFLLGYAWSLSYDALQRHLHAYWAGEDDDPESNLPHLAHAAWHCLALLAFSCRGVGTDDRPVLPPAPFGDFL